MRVCGEMLLSYFTEEAYKSFLHDIRKNAENYASDEDWLAAYFSGTDGYFKTSSVDVGAFNPHYTPG